jgi:hypothetical protein
MSEAERLNAALDAYSAAVAELYVAAFAMGVAQIRTQYDLAIPGQDLVTLYACLTTDPDAFVVGEDDDGLDD